MSYILEALRRAEAERERGLVPGLHAQSAAAADVAVAAGTMRWRAWAPWAVAGAAVLVAAGLAWTWRAGPVDGPPAAGAAEPLSAPVSTAALPPQQTTGDTTTAGPTPASPNMRATLPTSPPMAAVVPVPVPVPALPSLASKARPGTVAGRPSTPAAVGTASAQTAPPGSSAAAAANPGDAASASTEHHVYTLAELPEATRRELPTLSIAGASYSEHPANRLLIVNGNVFHEGDRLAPDLLLERIDLKAAVLHYKDVWFSVTY